jgi:hypothetical protein
VDYRSTIEHRHRPLQRPQRNLLQIGQTVLIARTQRLALSLRNPNKLALAHKILGRDVEFDRMGEVALITACNTDLQGSVGANDLVVDFVDKERAVGLVGEVVVAGNGAEDVAGEDGGGDGCLACGVGEEDHVDLRACGCGSGRWRGGHGCGDGFGDGCWGRAAGIMRVRSREGGEGGNDCGLHDGFVGEVVA